jgi:hypothetical protein
MPDYCPPLLLEGEDPIEKSKLMLFWKHTAQNIRCSLESIDASELIETQFTKKSRRGKEKIKRLCDRYRVLKIIGSVNLPCI